VAPGKKLLLVGWDSADWKIIHPLIDAGCLPGLASLVEQGISGNLATLEPQLSPMLWTSIATGKMAYHHGVAGFTEVDPVNGQVIPVSYATRRCKTIWEILSQSGLRSHVVSWFATQGEQNLNGTMVSNMFCHLNGVTADQEPDSWPAPPPGTYWPSELASTMNDLRVSPFEIDPDQILRLFVPDAPNIDFEKDHRLWQLAKLLGETFSVHSAATHLMETDPGWDFMAVYYRAIDEISHLFMPYHPPKMEGISPEDFEMYKEVVTGAYRLHDLFLQRLIHLAGEDTAVVLVSDHGFHSDHLRPRFTPGVPAGITVWHRPQGIIAARGPDFNKDELVFAAGLLDITPTILHYFGLPVGADMEGRVLEESFSRRVPPVKIPTWEDAGGIRRKQVSADNQDTQALLEQFVLLGYIEEIPTDPSQAAAGTRRENEWNMARAWMHGGHFDQALPLLENCFFAQPHRTDYAQLLASCQLQLGLLEEAEESALHAMKAFGQHETSRLLLAAIALQKEEHAKALALLEPVRDATSDDPQILLMLAQCQLQLRRWADAEETVQRVLAIDPHNPQAYLNLARQQLHQKNAEAAVESSLEAIGLQYGNPQGHFLLGAALAQRGQWEQAERALLNCLQLDPTFLRAYRALSRVYRAKGDESKAIATVLQFREILKRSTQAMPDHLEAVRREAALRAECRPSPEPGGSLQDEASRSETEEMEFVIVSGLPRSGTSLMMQLLQAGGLTLMTDGKRQPDEDNPEGYWEWEEIKKLPRDPYLIEQAAGKVVKVISALLTKLPARHRYKIIYMTRPMEEVVSSQWAMLQRTGQKPRSEKEHLNRVLTAHNEQVLAGIRASGQIDLLEVSFPELVADPSPVLQRLSAFLPGQFHAGPDVVACVKPRLYRNRRESLLCQSTTLHRQKEEVDRSERAGIKGQSPWVIWLTGLSGSGKSTIANCLERKLHDQGKHTMLLDGDNVRLGLNKDLDFTQAGRVENIRRIGEVAGLMADAGLVVITAFISPYQSERSLARSILPEGEFLEVFVDAPLAVCEERDPKGLYRKARQGLIPDFTGISAPYEAPQTPELHLDTTRQSIVECAEAILALLEQG
jgi:adenylyl-sulfate kinase